MMKKLLVGVVMCVLATPVFAQASYNLRELAVLQTEIEMYQERISNIEKSLSKINDDRTMYNWITDRDRYYNIVHQKQQRVRVLCGESTVGLCAQTSR